MTGAWEWSGPLPPLAVLVLSAVFGALIVLVILWIALPFAVFGVKRVLREIRDAQAETNRELSEIRRSLERIARDAPAREASSPRPPRASDTPPGVVRPPGYDPGI